MPGERSATIDRVQEAPDELWSLKQVAAYLGISVDYARHTWASWVDQGVTPIRLNGKERGALRFRRGEILALLTRWQVVQQASNHV